MIAAGYTTASSEADQRNPRFQVVLRLAFWRKTFIALSAATSRQGAAYLPEQRKHRYIR